eukprot:TRINITY_DN1017_c1_g2_i2.p2 TRINITY_DN1017_c1_g2~~TRINITY_DN1017_c1_g2_i2.p2  ORF type:complete len:157 (+),score=56.07 TRINITY_DN1017_c1_g2_i2:55-471(+)
MAHAKMHASGRLTSATAASDMQRLSIVTAVSNSTLTTLNRNSIPYMEHEFTAKWLEDALGGGGAGEAPPPAGSSAGSCADDGSQPSCRTPPPATPPQAVLLPAAKVDRLLEECLSPTTGSAMSPTGGRKQGFWSRLFA